MTFEYKVIPAPIQVKRSKDAKTAGERLALEVQDSINEASAEGWEYVRSDTMTVKDRPIRFARAVEVSETVLVFKRPKEAQVAKTPAKRPAAPKTTKAKPAVAASAKNGASPKSNGTTHD